MRNIPIGSALLFALIMVAGAISAAAEPVHAPGEGPWNLTLFHTNDAHSAFLPRPAHWRGSDGRMVGGVIPLAWHLAEQRKAAAPDIFLDAGDFMTGNPVCTLKKDGVEGYAVAAWMNGLGYDAGVVGNHEFDAGSLNARRLARLFEFPMLAADIENAQGEPAFRRDPVILERGVLRIGVMGVSCAGMHDVVTPARFGPLKLVDQVSLIRAQITRLDPETDLLVLITHDGVQGDRELAAELARDGLDVIVGGHSHTRLTTPEVVDDVLIVQAGSNLTALGRLDLEVRDDRVARYDGRLITLWSDGATADPYLTELVAGLEAEVRATFGRTIGILEADLRRGRGETALGNFLADALRARSGADAALINSGGIRKALLAGPVTAMDIHEVLPFANSLVVAEMTGAQLAAAVQTNADAQMNGTHGILQVSGLTYGFRDGDGAAVLHDLEVGGAPLDPARTYRVAMPDFVAMMANVYLGQDPPRTEDLKTTLTQVVIEEVERKEKVEAAIEGRIRRLD